jgi:hypothetical protein
MSKVILLPNVPNKLARFFGEVAGQHIPELLLQLEGYLRKTTEVIEQCAAEEGKRTLIDQRSSILRLLEEARSKAGQL